MFRILSVAIAASLVTSAAQAQLKVGATLSLTGPAASLGIPEKNTIDLMPKKIGGLDVTYIVLDDASDTTKAVTNTKKSRLDVAGMMALLLKLDFMQRIARGEHATAED